MESLQDCAVIVETQESVKVNIVIPPTHTHISIDLVTNGIIVHAGDGEMIHCFVPLPKNADMDNLQATFQNGILHLEIPRAS